MNDDHNTERSHDEEAIGLSARALADIEGVLSATGFAVEDSSAPDPTELGIAAAHIFEEVWREALESAPIDARLDEVRREANRVAHESAALTIAWLAVQEPDVFESMVLGLEAEEMNTLTSRALWLSECLRKFH